MAGEKRMNERMKERGSEGGREVGCCFEQLPMTQTKKEPENSPTNTNT
jgi:hypothetical protein